MAEKVKKYWRVQGKKNGKWKNISAEWRDRIPNKKEARDLFKGVKDKYDSVRVIKVHGDKKEVRWKDKELLNQEIPIETVRQ